MSQAAYALVASPRSSRRSSPCSSSHSALRFGCADMKRQAREGSAERAFVAAALEEAIGRLREQAAR